MLFKYLDRSSFTFFYILNSNFKSCDMASFSAAYSLCSLADQKGFVHVTTVEDDCALVTLGNNIVISYRLNDQKQLNSWSTIQKLSSKVIYNEKNEEFMAVFNETTIKKWTKQETNLDKVSKIKLKEPAHEILLGEEPIVLFRSGACGALRYFTDKDHTPLEGFLPKDCTIITAKVVKIEGGIYLFLTAVDKKHTWCFSVQLDDSTLQILPSTVAKLPLKHHGQKLLGSCFISKSDGEGLVTLWSDGFIFLLPLPVQSADIGRFVGTVRSLAVTSIVAMLAVSGQHIILYGGDPSEEGAVLAVYNLDFAMVQASMSFKYLQKPPRVWAVQKRLLVCVGQRLVCIPYALETGKVEALVGTRPVKMADPEMGDIQPIVAAASWEDGSVAEPWSGAPLQLKGTMETLTAQGCSEAGVCSLIISDLIEKQDITNLSWCLGHFIDIPETLCVQLVYLALNAEDETFIGRKKTVKRRSKSVDQPIMNGDGGKHHDPVHPPERSAFLRKILDAPVSKTNLFTALRTGLKFEQCLNLLQYLTYSLRSGMFSNEENILLWATTVIDAFYVPLIQARESKVLESVAELQSVVDGKVDVLNEMMRLLPLLRRIAAGQNLPDKPVQAKSYSIRKLQLYK